MSPSTTQQSTLANVELDTAIKEVAHICGASPDEIEDVYPCTPLQIGLMAGPDSRSYTEIGVFSLAPSIDSQRLRDALKKIESISPILRTKIVDSDYGLVQVVFKHMERLEVVTDRSIEEVKKEQRELDIGFGTPLYKMTIVEGHLIFTIHHSIYDYWTSQTILGDVEAVYNGREPRTHTSYRQFAQHCETLDDQECRSFWEPRFSGQPVAFPAMDPTVFPDARSTQKLKITFKAMGQVSAAVLPSYIEAAWAMTESLYTGAESVTYGIVFSGRGSEMGELRNAMGPTVSTVPIQVDLDPTSTIRDIVSTRSTERRKIASSVAVQYGLGKIKTISEAAREACKFNSVLNIRTTTENAPDANEFMQFSEHYDHRGTYALAVSVDVTSTNAVVEANFDSNIIPDEQMTRIMNQFKHILYQLAQSPDDTPLNKLQMLNMQDRRQLRKWNEGDHALPDKCLHNLFRERARSNPQDVAVDGYDGHFTYEELDQKTDAVAGELKRRGVKHEDFVTLCFEKSAWAVVAFLGVMKAGAACIPIDPTFPDTHKKQVIEGSKVAIMLTSSTHLETVDGLAPTTMVIDAQTVSELPAADEAVAEQEKNDTAKQAAYVLFTSGSTGTPKGIVLEHRNLVATLDGFLKGLEQGQGSRMLQFAAYVWGASIIEIFGTLMTGGSMCVPSEDDRQAGLGQFMESKKVDCAILTPTVIRTLSPEESPNLKVLCSAGEPVDTESVKLWSSQVRFVNGWGQSETAVASAMSFLSPDSRYPESVGKPVTNAVWIAKDGDVNTLAPIGTVGEVLIEGPGVSRGYLNNEEKTAECFIAPPSWAPTRKGAPKDETRKFYRSGDLARFNPDGSINHVGRRDNQVKMRGQRFELGQVEKALASRSVVGNAFVMKLVTDDKRDELAAILCLQDKELPSENALQEISSDYDQVVKRHLISIRNHLEVTLPSYMIPTAWLVLEKMPRTASAKVDRGALRKWLNDKDLSQARLTEVDDENMVLTEPANEKERILQSIWSQILAVPEEQIGRESSFARLGGDSITAMRVATKCRHKGMKLSVATVLRSENLEAVANASEPVPGFDNSAADGGPRPSPEDIKKRNKRVELHMPSAEDLAERDDRIEVSNVGAIAKATSMQHYILTVGDKNDGIYRLVPLIESEKGFDTERLSAACRKIIEHHAILRTAFVQHGAHMYQVELKKPLYDAVTVQDDNGEEVPWSTADKLFAIHLLRNPETGVCHKMRIEIHHALYDASGFHILMRDLAAAYEDQQLTDGPKFPEWAMHVDSMDHTESREVWTNILEGSSMTEIVPNSGPATCDLAQQVLRFKTTISSVPPEYGTMANVAQAAWSVLLSRMTGSRDVTFGSIVENRGFSHPDVDKVAGPCLNRIPVRAKLTDNDMKFGALVRNLQDQALDTLPHHHIGWMEIFKECTDWPSWTRFNSVLTYRNYEPPSNEFKLGDTTGSMSIGVGPADTTDMLASVGPASADNPHEMELALCFPPGKISEKQANHIGKTFMDILETFTANPEEPIHGGDYVPFMGENLQLKNKTSSDNNDNESEDEDDLSDEALVIAFHAWKEVGLNFEIEDIEDCSMFDCGATVITPMLLARWCQGRGYSIDRKDLVENPTLIAQAKLLDSKLSERAN